eukprot:gb/GECG01012069.1/.p1 GENE.gb/GECG01012069.1/~~gb/GECG01012069.1/.p1  ORF type:complete len:127 (+),score=28.07 gb/GECG01012069.1/:1-381(+)
MTPKSPYMSLFSAFGLLQIPSPGEGADPKLHEVYQELMDHMKYAEEHQHHPHRSGESSTDRRTKLNEAERPDYFSNYTLGQLMGHFEQMEQEKGKLANEEDEELQRIQGLGLFNKATEQEEHTQGS